MHYLKHILLLSQTDFIKSTDWFVGPLQSWRQAFTWIDSYEFFLFTMF